MGETTILRIPIGMMYDKEALNAAFLVLRCCPTSLTKPLINQSNSNLLHHPAFLSYFQNTGNLPLFFLFRAWELK
jgi:hypothetical protein